MRHKLSRIYRRIGIHTAPPGTLFYYVDASLRRIGNMRLSPYISGHQWGRGAYGTAIATLSGVTVRMFLAALLGNAKAGVFWSQIRFTLVFMITALACGFAWWLCHKGVSLWVRSAVFLASLLLPMLAAPLPLLTKVVTDNVQRAMKGRR